MSTPIRIIGAGIGGLTLGLHLKQAGNTFRIYEAAESIKPVGAGILLASNAMQIFKRLGMDQEILNSGQRITTIQISDAKGRPLSIMDMRPFEKKYGVSQVALHRAALQRLLADKIDPSSLFLGKKLFKVEEGPMSRLHFEDGSQDRFGLLIGADGIHSVVRKQFVGNQELRDSGQVCWRGVCTYPLGEAQRNRANEWWGRGKRFGWVAIDSERVYWYAVAKSVHLPRAMADLGDLFKEFGTQVSQFIQSSVPEEIHFTPLQDLRPLDRWHTEKISLLGDAAHATTPNMGQGACQAIEDAYVLGELLKRGIPPPQAFHRYQQIRAPRAVHIVRQSRWIGLIAHLENPWLSGARNLFFRYTPPSLQRLSFDRLYKLPSF